MKLKLYSAGLAGCLATLSAPLEPTVWLGFGFLLLAGSAARVLWGRA